MFIVPRSIADEKAHRDNPTAQTAELRWWWLDQVLSELAEFEDNFTLSQTGRSSTRTADAISEDEVTPPFN